MKSAGGKNILWMFSIVTRFKPSKFQADFPRQTEPFQLQVSFNRNLDTMNSQIVKVLDPDFKRRKGTFCTRPGGGEITVLTVNEIHQKMEMNAPF